MLWITLPAVKAQAIYPGGVKAPVQWYVTDTSVVAPAFRNQLDSNKSLFNLDHASTGSLNFHPSLIFSGANFLSINLGDIDLHSSSYFTVYHSTDTTTENSIWHITDDKQTTLVLTTSRMAMLPVSKYMNYTDVVRTNPKVNVYVQSVDKDSAPATHQSWNIGVKPGLPRLPITNFKGLVPEVIAYDRVLNSTERLQVASYLALKYGITLTEPSATYLNSAGQKLWNGYDYPAWHRNIAGICRDDTSGLYQPIATSSNTPGLLTIAARDSLRNDNFLLWGDNGKDLIPVQHTAGFPMLLQKTWLMKIHGNLLPFTTDVVLDTKAVDAPLPVSPVYWLAIDRSGEATFHLADLEFIKMDKLDNQGKAFFKNVSWDKDGSGKDVLGIIAGRDLLLATDIIQPACSSPGTGSLQIKIAGGQAPFQLGIQRKGDAAQYRTINDVTNRIDVLDLRTGKYFLQVKDASQNMYADSFYINNGDVPTAASIDSRYTITGGRPVELNAAHNMPDGLSWEWRGPGDFQSYSPQVTITKPGLYTLRCSKNGCSNTQDVTVVTTPNNILYDVTVYPNPSVGAYNARVTLDKPAMVSVTLFGPDGKLIGVQKGAERANYLFTGQLATAGVYRLVFTSGLSKTTKTLVIAR